jgi:hypothetical protein
VSQRVFYRQILFIKKIESIEMSVLLSGSIELNGTARVEITSELVTRTSRVFLKGTSGPVKGSVVISEMTPGIGFGLSSTAPEDVGVIIYFDVTDDGT